MNSSIVLSVNCLLFMAVGLTTGLSTFTYIVWAKWSEYPKSYITVCFSKFRLLVIVTSINELVLCVILVGNFAVFAKLYISNKFCRSIILHYVLGNWCCILHTEVCVFLYIALHKLLILVYAEIINNLYLGIHKYNLKKNKIWSSTADSSKSCSLPNPLRYSKSLVCKNFLTTIPDLPPFMENLLELLTNLNWSICYLLSWSSFNQCSAKQHQHLYYQSLTKCKFLVACHSYSEHYNVIFLTHMN